MRQAQSAEISGDLKIRRYRARCKKISGTTVTAVPPFFIASYKTHIHNRQHEAEVPQPSPESAPSGGIPAPRKCQDRTLR